MEHVNYLDLSIVKPGYNYKIIGPKGSGKKTLRENIAHLLTMRKCKIDYPYRMHSRYKLMYVYPINDETNEFEIFNIELYDSNSAPLHFEELDIIFVHSQYINKKKVAQDYYNKGYYKPGHITTNNINFVNGMDSHSLPYTFFVLQNHHSPPALRKIEHNTSYLTDFNNWSYNYSNITKLTNNILNRHSSYHEKNGELYKILQLKLKELYKIYCMIFCLKYHEIWLPCELNLEIMKLFFLMYL